MVYGVIYGLYDPLTGDLRYVGQTTRPLQVRLRGHLSPKSLSRPVRSARWLAKLCRQHLRPIMVELAEAESREELDRLEIGYIARARVEGVRLTNHTQGGRGQKGREFTKEARAKMSQAKVGRPGPWLGKARSEETKAKLREKCRGLNGGSSSVHFRHEVTAHAIVGQLLTGKSKAQVARDLGISKNLLYLRLRQAKAAGIRVPQVRRVAWNKGRPHSVEHVANWRASRWGKCG